MRQMFVNKVKETELELKEKEREVRVGLGVVVRLVRGSGRPEAGGGFLAPTEA